MTYRSMIIAAAAAITSIEHDLFAKD